MLREFLNDFKDFMSVCGDVVAFYIIAIVGIWCFIL